MSKPTIIEETAINIVELKQELEKIKERDGELNFRANKTEEYLNTFATSDAKKVEELKKKLTELDASRLKEQHIQKIIDLLPTTAEELRGIMSAYSTSLTKEQQESIIKVVKEYV
jgi:DNA-directed RNA polymerase subunit F